MEENIFDLEAAIKTLCAEFQAIEKVYIFGSRRFNTGSTRSDIDILLECDGFIKDGKLRDFIIAHNSGLDLFLIEKGRARSIANDSWIEAENDEALIKKLSALLLYQRGTGSTEDLQKIKSLAIDKRVDYKLTTLPNTSTEGYEIAAFLKYVKTARQHGLPTKPYLGISTSEAAETIVEVIRNMITSNQSVTNYGAAKSGWTNKLDSEYNFQNLFWITTKPWLSGLSREEVAITYDKKKKCSDFSLFNSQLILEFKHIKDDSDARETAKTLEGLKTFYEKHPNVRLLIFSILVDKDVDLDDRKWEHDFSYKENNPAVWTVVVRNSI